MSFLRRLAPAAAVISLGALLPVALAQDSFSAPNLPPATRGPVRVAFSRDGARAFVSETDSGAIAVVDTAAGRVLRHVSTGGKRPTGLAATPDGSLLVCNSYSGSVALLDPQTGARRALARLPGEPWDVELSADGKRAFVSLAQMDEVVALRLPGLEVAARGKTGRRPRALALVPGGRYLIAANLQGGDLSILDTATLRETRRVPLTGVNLRDVSVSPDGRTAFVTGQIPANTRSTKEPLDIWTNTVFRVDLSREQGETPPPEGRDAPEGWIDFGGQASADPDGVVALDGERAAVALSGCDQALLIRTHGPYMRTYDPNPVRRTRVGIHPRGLALSPDGKQLWVANELDSSVSVLDATTLEPVRRISLGLPAGRDERMAGRYLFGNAALTAGHQFTCNSCHPDGNTDGLTWEFVHVGDGLVFRNSRNLRGGVIFTSPFRWSGHEENLEDFLQDEIGGLLHGPRQDHEVLHALWSFLADFPMPDNPYRAPDGRLTPAAQRGKALFTGKAGCVSCHGGELHGGTGKEARIGTTDEGYLVDVPHLAGAYDSAPYLHDGRAATLEEVFTRHNAARLHGKAHLLTPAELADLLRFVREL